MFINCGYDQTYLGIYAKEQIVHIKGAPCMVCVLYLNKAIQINKYIRSFESMC